MRKNENSYPQISRQTFTSIFVSLRGLETTRTISQSFDQFLMLCTFGALVGELFLVAAALRRPPLARFVSVSFFSSFLCVFDFYILAIIVAEQAYG